ncbi:MAG: peptidyl-prolyl cis-trans isomerase [Bacteroidota bacterium]
MRLRRSLTWAYTLVLLVGSLSGCTSEDQPLASANASTITAEDFVQTYVTFLLNTGGNDTLPNRYRHLNNLIDATLLAEEARRRGLDADSAYQAYVERERQKALATRYYEEAFLATLPEPTDEEVRRAFINRNRQIVVRHLFFRSEEEAQRSYERLLAGRDFLDEAQDVYGLATYDSTAGYIGPVGYFSTDDAFAEAAFSLQPGTISPPVQSRHGWHIIRSEDVISNPLLTESEFQTRRSGIAGRERLRQRRLEGDSFVRDFMEGLDVQVASPAVLALQQQIAALENTEEGAVRGVQVRAALAVESGAPLDPETVLITYQQGDALQTFTVGNYLFWLDTLPFAEARHRTGASVGRALRNHALAEAGRAAGLEDDPRVVDLTERTARTRLAVLLRRTLQAEPPPNDEVLLREAFERFGYADSTRIEADFTVARFASKTAADAFRARVETGEVALDAAPDTEAFEAVSLAAQPYRHAVQRAQVGDVVTVGLPTGTWALIRVERRETIPPQFEDARDAMLEEIGPFLNEVALTRDLRENATLRLDTTRFEELYYRVE